MSLPVRTHRRAARLVRLAALASLVGSSTALAVRPAAAQARAGGAVRATPPRPASTGAVRANAARIVSIGGGITETLAAIGYLDRIVGIDLTSSGWPPSVAKLPQVGQLHGISAEGILSLRPTLVVANAEAGPPAALSQVRSAGVRVAEVHPARSEREAYRLYREVATAVGRPAAGDSLVRAVQQELARVRAAIPAGPRPRVLFLYARGPRFLLVFGQESAGDEMLQLAGAENAVTGFTGAKPLTPESVVGAAPDVILVPARGLHSLGGIDGVLALPGLAQTPAGRARRVVPIDDALILGFGPRLPDAVRTLARVVRSSE
jgi:iron complex transport system substrate-binding protein